MERTTDAVPSTLRARQREMVGFELRQAALELFRDKGFPSTTVDEIARRAGVSRSTFFRYFGSKEAVVVRELDDSTVDFLRFLRDRPAGESRMHALEAALMELAESRRSDERRTELLLVDEIISSEPSLTSAVAARTVRSRQEVAQVLAEREGRSEPDLEDLLAAAILGQITDHISLRWREDGDRPPVRELISSHFDVVRRLVAT